MPELKNVSGADADPAAAFNRTYAAHQRPVYAYLLARVNDRDTAADLLQETFLRVWRRVHEFTGASPLHERNSVFSAARSAIIDFQRARSSRKRTQPRGFASAAAAQDPADAAASREQLAQLDRAIANLDEDLRTPLIMSVIGGCSSEEIGAALELPPGTVRFRIHQARQALSKLAELQPQPQPQSQSQSQERTSHE